MAERQSPARSLAQKVLLIITIRMLSAALVVTTIVVISALLPYIGVRHIGSVDLIALRHDYLTTLNFGGSQVAFVVFVTSLVFTALVTTILPSANQMRSHLSGSDSEASPTEGQFIATYERLMTVAFMVIMAWPALAALLAVFQQTVAIGASLGLGIMLLFKVVVVAVGNVWGGLIQGLGLPGLGAFLAGKFWDRLFSITKETLPQKTPRVTKSKQKEKVTVPADTPD
jgi:hypothetical protein